MTQTAGHDDALAWARLHLAGEPHATPMKTRPWATTWRLRVSASRTVYLKVSSASTRYEAALVPSLAAAVPHLVPEALAADADHGWLLLADAGQLLREQLGGTFGPRAWERMVHLFAQLQRAAEPLTTALLAAGVPDERPARLANVLATLSSRPAHPRWARAAAKLAAYGVPDSIQHGDLHDGNVGIGTDGAPRFFDFGDASVAHPFTTMLVPLQVAASLGADDLALQRLRDAYLDPFRDLASPADLRRCLALAVRLGRVSRAAAWERALRAAPPDHPWGDPVEENLRELRYSDRDRGTA